MLFSYIYFMSSAQGDWGILNKLDNIRTSYLELYIIFRHGLGLRGARMS